jgi:hypothetical protein
MAKRISGSDLVGQKQEVGLAGNVPGQLARDVGSSSRSLHTMFAPTIQKLQEKEGRRLAKQGIVDGQKSKLDPKLLYSPSFKGKAYTDSAVTAYMKTLELETRQATNDILAENQNDSAKAGLLLKNYYQGRIDGMPPALQERFGQTYQLQATISASSGIATIRRKENTNRLKLAKAQNIALETEVAKGLPGIAMAMGSSDSVEQKQGILAYVQERSRIDGAYDSVVGELASGGADLAFDPADKHNALAKFDNVVSRNMIEQKFNDADDKRAYYRAFKKQELEDSYKIKDDEGEEIADLRPSPATRRRLDAYMNQAINGENALLNKQQAAVKKSVTAYADAITNNRPVSPDEETALQQAVGQFGSPDQQERYENWFNFKPEYETLRGGSLADIDRSVRDMNGEIDQAEAAGEFVSKGTIERRDMVVKLRDEKAKLLSSDPIAAGIAFDGQEDIGPLDTSEKMQAQAINAHETSEKYGTPLRILSKNNLGRINRIWENPDLKGENILSLISTLDGFMEDKSQVISEIAPKNPSLAHIAVLMNNGADETVSYAARGLALIRTGQSKFPGEKTKVAADEAAILGNAYRMHPKELQAVIATAQAIYVAKIGNKPDGRAEFDDDMYKQALKEASGEQEGPNGITGGIIKMGPGIFGGSHSVVVPHDVSQEEFKKAMEEGFSAEDLAKGGLNGGATRPRATGGAETIDTREATEDYKIPIPVGDGLFIWGRELGNGEVEILRGNTDSGHEHPAVRQGFYVTDYAVASANKKAREENAIIKEEEEEKVRIEVQKKDREEKAQKFDKAVEGAGDTLQDLGDKLGDFGDQVFEGIFGGEPQAEKTEQKQPADQPGLLDDLKGKGSDVKDFAGRSGEELGNLVKEGATAITKGAESTAITAQEKAKELKSKVEELGTKAGKAIDEAPGFIEELGRDFLSGIGDITKGIIEVAGEIQSGIQTVKEFAEENIPEAKQLAKLVELKVRKLTSEKSVKVFASSVAPMIVTPGSVEGLPPVENIITALVEVESSFRPNQVSRQGATGPAQIMPGTAQDIADRSNLGYTAKEILKDPEKNIMAGMWYFFEDLLPKFKGPDRLQFAMAAYHAGAGGVNKARAKSAHKNDYKSVEINLGPKTQNYVKKFTKALKGNL